MKKLSLLILCLLVTCKVFTQIDIPEKTEYVFLTESQAKRNIVELIKYDALQLISVEQENRITAFKATIAKYERVVKRKDSIIGKKDEIIDFKDKIIKAKKPVEFHTYAGVETYNFNFTALSFYGRAYFEFKKINLGAKLNYSPTPPDDNSNIYYNIILEYKIF